MSALQRLSPLVASIALFALLPGNASPQATGNVSGQVAYSGGPVVPGVQVLFPELGLRADTDGEGRFELAAVRPGEHRLLVYALGCELAAKTVEVKPGEATEVTVQVGPRAFALDELIVTGTPSERSRAELPFSVEELSGDRLRTATAAGSVANLLRGMAGGRVVRGSGLPGQESDILLRGPATLGGAEQQPLVVVDGIIAGHSTAGIDPMDVERIEVLKGAAAAAHYGSRAQGGVIEITTKRRPPDPEPVEAQPLLVVDGYISEGDLGDIDTRDIVDIRVLRGPAATLVAGPRGAAGIIRVTTARDFNNIAQCPADLSR
jgi:TonB-dependent SusC/RagA subfamily outer membrane receptor